MLICTKNENYCLDAISADLLNPLWQGECRFFAGRFTADIRFRKLFRQQKMSTSMSACDCGGSSPSLFRVKTALGPSLLMVVIGFFFAISPLSAQQFTLHFPHFAGQAYDILFMRGERADTVATGILPADGRLVFPLPEGRKQYAGMVRWLLRSGGGLDMVVNGEDFKVECLSPEPNEGNIVFSGTRENTFLNSNFYEQEKLLGQYEAIRMAIQAYPKDSPLYATFEGELQRLSSAYTAFQRELAATPLYAARFREIVNFTRGISRSLGGDEAQRAAEADDFLSRQMSWAALYTSNHWGGVIYSWVQLHLYAIKSDSAFAGSARRILSRLPNPELYTAFCERMAYYFVQNGKDSLLASIAPDIRASGMLMRSDGLLAQLSAVQPGELAPDLVIAGGGTSDGRLQNPQILKASALSTKATILVFYQSGCGPCETTMQQLQANYKLLADKGYRVMTISGDTDLKLFGETARSHPWKDKFCDGQGFEGQNFRRYGVAGTPTLFVVDNRGQIRTRAGGLPEILLWLEKNG